MAAKEVKVVGIEALRCGLEPRPLRDSRAGPHSGDDGARHLGLQLEDVIEPPLEGLRPDLVAIDGAHQLHVDAHGIRLLAHATLEHRGNVQAPSDFAHVVVAALERERRAACSYPQTLDARQLVANLLGQAVREILVCRLGAQVREREYRDRVLGRVGCGNGQRRCAFDARGREIEHPGEHGGGRQAENQAGDDEAHVARGIECIEQQVERLRQDPRARDVVQRGAHHATPPQFRPQVLRIAAAHRQLSHAPALPRPRTPGAITRAETHRAAATTSVGSTSATQASIPPSRLTACATPPRKATLHAMRLRAPLRQMNAGTLPEGISRSRVASSATGMFTAPSR